MSILKSHWTNSVKTILTKESKALSMALVFRKGHKWDGFIPGIWDENAIYTKKLGIHRYPWGTFIFFSKPGFLKNYDSAVIMMYHEAVRFWTHFSCKMTASLIVCEIPIQVHREAFVAMPRKSAVPWPHLVCDYKYSRRMS